LADVPDDDGEGIENFPVPVFAFDDAEETDDGLADELPGQLGQTVQFQDKDPAFHGQDLPGHAGEGRRGRIEADGQPGTLHKGSIEDGGDPMPLGRILFMRHLFPQQVQNHANTTTFSWCVTDGVPCPTHSGRLDSQPGATMSMDGA